MPAKPKDWIAGAVGKNPGALHRQLGVSVGDKIPLRTLDKAAAGGDTKLAKRARLAKTLRGMSK